MSQSQKLILIKPGNIGDHLCTLPLYIELKKKYQELILVTQTGSSHFVGAENLLGKTKLFTQIFTLHTPLYSYKNFELLTKLFFVQNAKIALVPVNKIDSKKLKLTLLFWGLFFRKNIVGFKSYDFQKARQELKNKKLPLYETNRLLKWGKNNFQCSDEVDFTKIKKVINLNKTMPKNQIVISAWSNDSIKNWPIENFIDVSNHLSSKGLSPVWIGSGEDRKRFKIIKKGLAKPYITKFGNPLINTFRLIAKSKAIISNDSMAIHMAALTKTPFVAIFSARTLPGLWWPRNSNGICLQRRINCEGCEIKKVEDCPRGQKCVTDIRVEDVNKSIDELLIPKKTTKNSQSISA